MKQIESLIKEALSDLQKVGDPYQHGMLAITIAGVLNRGTYSTKPVTDKSDLDTKPKMKTDTEKAADKPVFASMTPATDKVLGAMQEAAQATQNRTGVLKEAPQEAEEVDYDSEEWANRKLTDKELDDTWTERMLKNRAMAEHRRKMLGMLQFCKKDPVNYPKSWIDATIAKVTSGFFKGYSEQAMSPKSLITLEPSFNVELHKRFNEVKKANSGNQAA